MQSVIIVDLHQSWSDLQQSFHYKITLKWKRILYMCMRTYCTYSNSEYVFRLQLLLVSQISYCVWQERQAAYMFAHPLH